MRTVFLIAASLTLCVHSLSLDRLFRSYAGPDSTMELDEFSKYWGHFDMDGNGNVTKQEFDTTWKNEDLGDEDRAPFFFLEMDRVPDEVLNDLDYVHMFRIFDENGDSHITKTEFKFNWEGLFDE
ncbi:uncharacterized protein LOC101854804 [Aplysia californica]|uniref:Uncharacterized protein LOC101854804 n=1 Tax=Aplysia californica TaxID=6500 RepID=A0ABM0JSE0_APLCA|nr:uncharacterized protein LOC101854804 [Aplysia californica]